MSVRLSEAKAKFLFLLTILYVLSPLDLLPDALPVAGNVDDLILMFFGTKHYLSIHRT